MASKWVRNYKLQVESDSEGVLTFSSQTAPLTIEFDIVRTTNGSANAAKIRIYNLSEESRNQIRFNIFERATIRNISLQVGYGSDLSNIFDGNITYAWSVREGPNFITQIECFDGGIDFSTAQTNRQVKAIERQTVATFIRTGLFGDLVTAKPGAVGSFPQPITADTTYCGPTIPYLKKLTNGGFFIDLKKAYALNNSEYLLSTPLLINSASGLLNTPVLQQNVVTFTMLLEPKLQPGRAVFLESIVEKAFNGINKITGVTHRGTISGAVCGDATTTGEFLYLKELEPIPSL